MKEEIVTMRPQPSAIMSGTANRIEVNVPVRSTAKI
jgi:hypothetical protein